MADSLNTDPVEIWKPIAGWEGFYQISSEGRVRSLPRVVKGRAGSPRRLQGRILKPSTPDGYPMVLLCRDGVCTTHAIHRLVCETFHGPRPPDSMVAHNDGSRGNCKSSNLRWATGQENSADAIRHGAQPTGQSHGRSKLCDDDVREIRRRRRGGDTLSSIAKSYGVDHSCIWQIATRKTWTHIEG